MLRKLENFPTGFTVSSCFVTISSHPRPIFCDPWQQRQAAFRLCDASASLVPGVPLAPMSEEVVEVKALEETEGDTFEGMFEAISGWW